MRNFKTEPFTIARAEEAMRLMRSLLPTTKEVAENIKRKLKDSFINLDGIIKND